MMMVEDRKKARGVVEEDDVGSVESRRWWGCAKQFQLTGPAVSSR